MGNIPNLAGKREISPVSVVGGLVIFAVIAAIVTWLVIGSSEKNKTIDSYNAEMSRLAVFTVGSDDAPTIDIVEDFMCPSCRAFEGTFGPEMAKKIDSGELRVRFHIVNFLDRTSASGDYSTRALAAAMVIADKAPDSWMKWHTAMYANQPTEGGDKDMTPNQMADLAIESGVPRDVADSLRDIGPYTPAAEKNASSVMDYVDENVARVSTPMVIKDGQEVEAGPGWLERLK